VKRQSAVITSVSLKAAFSVPDGGEKQLERCGVGETPAISNGSCGALQMGETT
jgi:hypothetical protein